MVQALDLGECSHLVGPGGRQGHIRREQEGKRGGGGATKRATVESCNCHEWANILVP